MKTTNDFVLEQISMRPEVTLDELRARAAMEGRRVREATFYRARADLGLDGGSASAHSSEPVVAPLQGPTAEAPELSLEQAVILARPATNGATRRRRQEGSLNHLAEAVESFLEDRNRLRDALTRMRDIVAEVLAR